MKKRYSTFAMALVIAFVSLAMTACDTSTSASENSAKATSFQSVTEIVTDAQGSTHVQEATKVVEINADGTVEKTEQSTEESTSPTEDKAENTNNAQNNNSESSQVSNNNNSNNSNNNSASKTENNKPVVNNTNNNSGGSSSSASSKPSSNNSGSNSSSSTAKPSGGNTSSSSSNTNSKVWHEAVYEYIEHPAVTEEVWVVDKEGYTWEKPIYKEVPSVICLTCGEDITDNIKGHDMEVHVPNDENFSYTVRRKKVLVDTEVITVPEEGHYETKVIKEAYTEKKLVKEAGYY